MKTLMLWMPLLLFFFLSCDSGNGLADDPDDLTTIDSATGTVTIAENVAGELASRLTDAQWAKVANITITGDMNVADFDVLKEKIASRLKNVNINETILTKIPRGAFAGESKSKSEVTPEEDSGWLVMYPDLEVVEIPDGVTEIEEGAFAFCTKLHTLSLPEGLKTIGRFAFMECTSLTDIIIPSTVETIAGMAFFRTIADEIILPEGLTRIGSYAFAESELKRVTIPSTVNTIGKGVFSLCEEMTEAEVKVPLDTIPSALFCDNGKLASIILAESDKTIAIGESAFLGTAISSIVLPPNLQTIYAGAFAGCMNLENFTVPNSVDTLHGEVFENCIALKDIDLGQVKVMYQTFKGCTSLEKVVLPESLTLLGESAFVGCSALKEIVISSSFERVYYQNVYMSYLFKGCNATITFAPNVTHLKDRIFAYSTLETFTLPDHITQIGDSLLIGSPNLTTVNLPKVTKIGAGAFLGLEKLTTVSIGGGSATDIELGERIFYKCTNLETVTFNSVVPIIPYQAFYGNTKLTSINLPEGLEKIKDEAFLLCETLAEIVLPSTLKEIGKLSFGVTNIETGLLRVICKAITPPTFPTGGQVYVSGTSKIYVPTGRVSAYSTAPGWSDSAANIERIP